MSNEDIVHTFAKKILEEGAIYDGCHHIDPGDCIFCGKDKYAGHDKDCLAVQVGEILGVDVDGK